MEILVLIISFLGILLPIIIYLLQKKFSEKLAKDTGGYDKPRPLIKFLDIDLENSRRYNIVVGCNYVNINEIMFEFPISLGNYGKKTLENIELVYTYPKNSKIPFEDNILKPETRLDKNDVNRNHVKTSDGKFSTFKIRAINPTNYIILVEPLLLFETFFDIKVPVKTKDNQVLIAAAAFAAYHTFELLFSAKDIDSMKFIFRIYVMKSEDIYDLKKKLTKSIQNASHLNKNHSIKNSLNEKYILVYPDLKPLFKMKNKQYYKATISKYYPEQNY